MIPPSGVEEVKSHNMNVVMALKDTLLLVNMHQLQNEDDAIGPVLRAMQSGDPQAF